MEQRDYRRLITSARWRALRARVLAEEPLCRRCSQQGRARVATEVHHIVPLEGAAGAAEMERLCYSRGNLMPLCRRCHAAEHAAMGRAGKAAAKRLAAQRLEGLRRWLGETGDGDGGG